MEARRLDVDLLLLNWAGQGATSLKAYMQITRDALKAAVDEGHRRGMKITVGANNVFDRDPPHALAKAELYDNLQVSGEGRFVFIRVSKEY